MSCKVKGYVLQSIGVCRAECEPMLCRATKCFAERKTKPKQKSVAPFEVTLFPSWNDSNESQIIPTRLSKVVWKRCHSKLG